MKRWKHSLRLPESTIVRSQRGYIPLVVRRQHPPSALRPEPILAPRRYPLAMPALAQPSITLTAGSTGTTPTTSSTVYTGGTISVGVTSVLEAIATGGGYTSSTAASAAFTILIATASPVTYVQQCNKYTAGGGKLLSRHHALSQE